MNLHYGAWPKVGMFWSEGIVSMDLIADYNKDVLYKSAIKLELNLSNIPDTLTGELKVYIQRCGKTGSGGQSSG